jgi:hypothetical protein
LFDRLMYDFSFQGISDEIAANYMHKHGRATYRSVRKNLAKRPTCPKLQTYRHFHDCRYEKTSRTCAEPDHIATCPLPTHRLRNGHRNQIAYSLYLFIRDVADGDLVGWIDDRWEQVNDQGPWRSEIVTPRAIKKTQDQRSGRRVPRHTRKDECLMDLNKTTATKHASSPQTDAPRKWGGRGAKLVFVQMLWGGRRT